MKFFAFIICAVLCTTIGADEVDDLRSNYTATLTQVAKDAATKVEQGQQNLETTELYFDHTGESFKQEGTDAITDLLKSINETAATLTLNAIIANKPATVLTCISTQHDRAYTTVDGRLAPYLETIDKAAAANNFEALGNELGIIAAQLEALLQINTDKINTCVVLECFDNNLTDARVQYDNLTKNVATLTETLNTTRDKFNTAIINALNSLRKNLASDQTSAEKNMNNCSR